MKLASFFAAIGPFLEGKASHAEATRALWPERPPEPDATRLAIYGRFCRAHRFEAVDGVFSETRAALVEAHGEPAWQSLVERHFAAHPMHHAELNENGLTLPAFLAQDPTLLPWLHELADLEAWEWRTRIAPDAEADQRPSEGPLRLASTVELRPYGHDLPAWREAEPRPPAPEQRPTRVLFWRDPELDPRSAAASDLELLLVKRVLEGAPVLDGLGGPEAGETLDDLRAAGILLGAPSLA